MSELLDLPGQAGARDRIDTLLAERPPLAVVAAVPRSGSSKLLAAAVADADRPVLLVDARPCVDGADLARAISDATIRRSARALLSWWRSGALAEDRDATELGRTLAAAGVDVSILRSPGASGETLDRLAASLGLVSVLLPEATVIIDHLGELLAGLPGNEADRLASDLRAFGQASDTPALLLVETPGAFLTSALADDRHAFYAAGPTVRIERPTLSAFTVAVGDLATALGASPEDARIAFTLAEGAPTLGSQLLQLAQELNCGVREAHERLLALSAPALGVQWTMLRRVHPHATSLASCLAEQLPTSRVPANRKSINDALARMRGLRVAWQPRAGEWRLADALLTAYLNSHRPPWIAAELSRG